MKQIPLQVTPQFSHGLAAQGPWLLAWASQVGSRHVAHGKPCEDSIGHRFHADQAIALAVGDGVSGGAAGEVASFAAVRYCTDFYTDLDADFGEDFGTDFGPGYGTDGAPQDNGPSARSAQAKPSAAQVTLWDGLPPAPLASPLQEHINGLDAHVQQAIAQHTGRAGASTLAAAWLGNDGAGWLTHLGDVRAYCFTPAGPAASALHRLTLDHTYANLGKEAPPYVPVDNPARMAGNGIAGTPPLLAFELEVGQALLLCTDGLHGFVTDAQIGAVLAPPAPADQAHQSDQSQPRTAMAQARRLLRLATKHGSDDDMAVLLLWRLAGAA